jgi:hypothetical protein
MRSLPFMLLLALLKMPPLALADAHGFTLDQVLAYPYVSGLVAFAHVPPNFLWSLPTLNLSFPF